MLLQHADWLQSLLNHVLQGTVDALQQIAKAEGSAGLLRGFWPTVWANAPFSAVYYMLYSDLKKRFHKVFVSFTNAGLPLAVAEGFFSKGADCFCLLTECKCC